jgi:hypothetical protein
VPCAVSGLPLAGGALGQLTGASREARPFPVREQALSPSERTGLGPWADDLRSAPPSPRPPGENPASIAALSQAANSGRTAGRRPSLAGVKTQRNRGSFAHLSPAIIRLLPFRRGAVWDGHCNIGRNAFGVAAVCWLPDRPPSPADRSVCAALLCALRVCPLRLPTHTLVLVQRRRRLLRLSTLVAREGLEACD